MPDRFRKAIDRIMQGSPLPVLHDSSGGVPDRPESRGWLRRPEHDCENGQAWEHPDGTLRRVFRTIEPAVGAMKQEKRR